jgi:hypothetical protein
VVQALTVIPPHIVGIYPKGGGGMSKNKVIKSVGFNITNPEDVEILKAVKRRNFSGYVKKLILADLKRKSEPAIKIDLREVSSKDKFALIKEQLKKAGEAPADN